MSVNITPALQVGEAAALLEEAGIAFAKDMMAIGKSRLPDPPDGQDHEMFLHAWAFRLAASSAFLRNQKMAGVLDDETLLGLVAFDIEVAHARLDE